MGADPRFWKGYKGKKKMTKREKALKKNILTTVKGLPEPKNHYTHQINSTVGFAGNIYTLSDPAQGDTSQTREGDRCTLTNISIRGRVMANGTANEYNLVRIIVFFWKVDSGERLPLMKDILQASYASSSQTPMGPTVVGQEADDLQIIVDRTYAVDTNSNYQKFFHINRKLNKKVYFNATAVTGKNQLFIMQVSDDGAVNYPRIEWVANCEFRDL